MSQSDTFVAPINPYYYDEWRTTDSFSSEGWAFELENETYLFRWDDSAMVMLLRLKSGGLRGGYKIALAEPFIYLKVHQAVQNVDALWYSLGSDTLAPTTPTGSELPPPLSWEVQGGAGVPSR